MSGPGDGRHLARAAAAVLGTGVDSVSPCPGGDINQAFRLRLGDGRTVFLKTRSGVDADEYRCEAAGLRWLAEPGGIGVPEPLAVIDEDGLAGLLMEWVEPGGQLSAGGHEEFGRGLARIHLAGAEAHGALPPGAPCPELRLGEAVLTPPVGLGSNPSFAAVYAGRIEMLARQALDVGNLDADGVAVLGRLADRMDDLGGPPVRPARLHGDLWSGNVMAGSGGRPWLVDPAAYGGHPEVDLAMLELFGSPSTGFQDAYQELNPPVDGHRERVSLWQIQPLLVHAVLFGGGYGRSAARVAARYIGRSA
jgi:fructosamine-3-kinase